MRYAILILVFFMFPIALHAQDLKPAAVGEVIPHSLGLKDQNGEAKTFENLTGENGLVIVFVRSADWCPYCQVQMLDMRNGEADVITDQGYNIVTLSYDAPETLKKFSERYNFPFTMLSDEGSVAIKSFGIMNEDFAPDHFAYGVPHPHVYVVGKDKVIQAVLAEEGYKNRPQIEAIAAAIKGL